jgi:general secretion pathway protein J
MHSKQRGLTLVELLVAISILGLVAVMGWRGLDGIMRSRSALTDELDQTRGMQLAFAQLQSDCAQLTNPANVQGRTTLNAITNKLTLVRNVYSDNQATRIQVVSYRVQEGKLMRRESPGTRDLNELDRFWLAAINNTEPDPAVTLQTGVVTMTLRTWVNGSWQLPANLANTAPPTGLEVVLQLPKYADGLIKNFLLGAV